MSSLGCPESRTKPFVAPPQDRTCDLLVIGGGPAGSTAATLLAEKGWRVTLLEKDHHPRFHIGESLLPMNLPILARLGVLEAVRKIGVMKPGIEMWSDRLGGKSQIFYFEQAMDLEYPYAFEVRRSEFDDLLLRNAAKAGVSVQEGLRVTEVETRADGTSLVHARDEAGQVQSWRCKFLIDASGRNAFLATRMGLKEKSKAHNSAAIFGHFRKVERRSGQDEGNIGLYWFDHGWIWMIPLRDDVMSVGAVCWPDYLKGCQVDLDAFLWQTIRLSPGVAGRMAEAELVAPAQATGNYSYRSRRLWGPGYLLIGDAHAFIDPVFSSGVYLAMNSAVMSAEAVHLALSGSPAAAEAFQRYEKRIDRGLKAWSWFIYRFTTPGIHDLFMAPRNAFQMESAILSLLAGDVFGKARFVLPLALFKGLYHVSSALKALRSLSALRRRRGSRSLIFEDETVL